MNFAQKKIAFCLTSCDRVHELEKTIDSFIEYNTYPIEEWFIVEDSANKNVYQQIQRLNKEKWGNRFTIIFNDENMGQAASIDKMYSQVKSEYIFHCEEDWEFYRSGFIEDSVKVLETQPGVLQVWIRPKSDKILNRIENKVFLLPGGVKVRRVLPVSFRIGNDRIVKNYMGFSWNPGLRRKSNWESAPINGSFSKIQHEHIIDAMYRDAGFMVVSLSINDNDGYCKHIGWGNRRMGNTPSTKNL